MTRRLPSSASVAESAGGDKLFAPSAARNADALTDVLRAHAPARGAALELASGTGQHVVAFATALPGLVWHPTEIDPDRRRSIDAHVAEARLANVRPARALDATRKGWGKTEEPRDVIVLANLLHLLSADEARTILDEAGQALAHSGRLVLYGPFKRAGKLTSAGDTRFDAELRGADAAIGYKDDLDIKAWLRDAGLKRIIPVEMPANNLTFVAERKD
jgi:hypothetical protein